MKIIMPALAKMTAMSFLLVSFLSCEKENLLPEGAEVLNASVRAMNTVEIRSTGMNFIAPEEIPSGWSTFEYTNGTNVPHFFLLVQLPEGQNLDTYREEVTVPFNNILKLLRGEDPKGPAVIAEWFANTSNFGGSGLIDPGKTAVTSVDLEPGNYIIECYVKMPNGDFHSVAGMLDQITVTEKKTKEKFPKASVSIAVEADGLQIDGEIRRPGLHTFAVDFPQGSTADVHLVRLEGASPEDKAALNEWMYWMNNMGGENEGFMTPAPQGFSFLGGTQELKNGGTTYFRALLKPGTYALISEVPDAMGSGYYHEFSVGNRSSLSALGTKKEGWHEWHAWRENLFICCAQ